MYSTSKRILALILLGSHMLTTTSCSSNPNVPSQQEITHRQEKLAKKPTKKVVSAPLPNEFDDKKEASSDPAITNELQIAKSTIETPCFVAKGGHQIQLIEQEGRPVAFVQENALVGFHRKLTLPVCLAPGLAIQELSQYSPEWHKAHIAVIFPGEKGRKKGYVYIGGPGLRGGGNGGSKGGGGNDNDRPSGSSDSSSSSVDRASHNMESAHSSFSMSKTSSSSSHSRDSFKDFCDKSSATASAALSSAGVKHDTQSPTYSRDSFKDFCDKSSATASAALSSAGIKHDTHSPSHTSFSSHASSYSSSSTSTLSARAPHFFFPRTPSIGDIPSSSPTSDVAADKATSGTASDGKESNPSTSRPSSWFSDLLRISSSSLVSESKAPRLTLENAAAEVKRYLQEASSDQEQEKGEQLLKQLREVKQQQERLYSQTHTAYMSSGNSAIGNQMLLDQLTKKEQGIATLKELESALIQSLERESTSSHYQETKKESMPARATSTSKALPKEDKAKDKEKEKHIDWASIIGQELRKALDIPPASSTATATTTRPTEPLASTPAKDLGVKASNKVTPKQKIPHNDREIGVDDLFNAVFNAVSATEPTNSSSSTTMTDKREVEIHSQWDDLLEEIQAQLGHVQIQGLADALTAQKQIKAYIEKLKSYEKYPFISRSSLEQALSALEKAALQVEAALDNERYNAVIGEIKQILDTRVETINRLQDEKADPAIIIATAQEIKPHLEAAIKRLEDFPTKQYKAPTIENLKEAKRQLEGVIRDYTQKVLWNKYKAAFTHAAKRVKERIVQEQEELAKSIGKPVGEPEVTITNKPGITIAQLEKIFPEVSSDTYNLQELLDTLDITVNFPAAAEDANSGKEEQASQEAEDDLEIDASIENKHEEIGIQKAMQQKEKEAKRQAKKEQRRANQKARRKEEASAQKAHEKELTQIREAKEQLKSLVKEQVAVYLNDAAFTNCRTVLLMIEERLKKEPNNQALQALKAQQLEKFQSHPFYSQIVALGIEAMALCQEAEQKADDQQIRATVSPCMILPSAINRSSEYRKESEEVETTIVNLLRDLVGCSHRPSGLRSTVEGVKGFAESFYDTGKLFLVDIPVLLDHLGMKGIESLVKWEDKLGIKEGWANLGEYCKKLFDETKQSWEDPEAYYARMRAAQEVKRREALYRRAFDAKNYHLGQDKWLGYIPAEAVQVIFGGQILKGAARGAAKGVQFIKRIQQGAKVEKAVVEGVKITGGAVQGVKAVEAAANIAEKVKNILKPGGELIGKQVGKNPAIRTITKQEAEKVIKQLMEVGAKQIENPRYPGIWYKLPGGREFGIRTKPSSKSVHYRTKNTIDLRMDSLKGELEKIKF